MVLCSYSLTNTSWSSKGLTKLTKKQLFSANIKTFFGLYVVFPALSDKKNFV